MGLVTSVYGSWTTITCSPASLASSATFIAGRQSTEVDNSTNKYIDARIAGKITVGTTPTTATLIRIYGVTRLDNTPTYPDAFGATDVARNILSVGVGVGYLMGPFSLSVDSTTSDRPYPFDFLWSDWF